MKIAYVTTYDSRSLGGKTWRSGYYIGKTLKERGISVEYIGPLKEKYSLIFRTKKYLYRHVFHKRYLRDREPFILKDYANQISRKLVNSDADIVLSPGVIPITYLECTQPIIFWTDSTFAGMVDFFPKFKKLCGETMRNGHAIEQAALDRCRLAIFSSDWAAQTACDTYRVDHSKIKVVSFGANIDGERTYNDIKSMVNSRPAQPCRLLFVGIDWRRKGGDIAVKVTEELNKSGLETELVVVGCQPFTDKPLPDFVKSLGYINTSTTKGLHQMNALYAQSHFLILPTRADCAPNVLREANAFGVPCISTHIAGIPMMIKNGVNGKTFSIDANFAEYCTYISWFMSHYTEYKNQALSAFHEYQLHLNWTVSGKRVEKMLLNIVGENKRQ